MGENKTYSLSQLRGEEKGWDISPMSPTKLRQCRGPQICVNVVCIKMSVQMTQHEAKNYLKTHPSIFVGTENKLDIHRIFFSVVLIRDDNFRLLL